MLLCWFLLWIFNIGRALINYFLAHCTVSHYSRCNTALQHLKMPTHFPPYPTDPVSHTQSLRPLLYLQISYETHPMLCTATNCTICGLVFFRNVNTVELSASLMFERPNMMILICGVSQSSSNSILHSSVSSFQTLTTTLMAMREILQRTGSLRMAQRPCHSLTSRPPCPLTSAHRDRMERPSHPHHQKGYDCMFKCLCVCFELEGKVFKQITCCR